MTVPNVLHCEAKLAEKLPRLTRDALSVLQRAGGMIGDHKSGRGLRGFDRQCR